MYCMQNGGSEKLYKVPRKDALQRSSFSKVASSGFASLIKKGCQSCFRMNFVIEYCIYNH